MFPMPAVSKDEHLVNFLGAHLVILAWATRTLIVRKLKGLEDLIGKWTSELWRLLAKFTLLQVSWYEGKEE